MHWSYIARVELVAVKRLRFDLLSPRFRDLILLKLFLNWYLYYFMELCWTRSNVRWPRKISWRWREELTKTGTCRVILFAIFLMTFRSKRFVFMVGTWPSSQQYSISRMLALDKSCICKNERCQLFLFLLRAISITIAFVWLFHIIFIFSDHQCLLVYNLQVDISYHCNINRLMSRFSTPFLWNYIVLIQFLFTASFPVRF